MNKKVEEKKLWSYLVTFHNKNEVLAITADDFSVVDYDEDVVIFHCKEQRVGMFRGVKSVAAIREVKELGI